MAASASSRACLRLSRWSRVDRSRWRAVGKDARRKTPSAQCRVRARDDGLTWMRSQGCDGRHLDQKGFLHEAVDDQKRIRRIVAARKHARELTPPECHELCDIL